MDEKTVDARVKAALEFGPLVFFLVAFFWLKDRHFLIMGNDYKGIIVVTAAFIVVMALATLALWRLTGVLSKMQLFSLVTVILLGGATVYLNDERYLKMKPTAFYVVCGGILGVGLLQGKSWLQPLMGNALPLQDKGWLILTRRFMLLFFTLAVANELVWRNFSTETWVWFKVIGLMAATFVFIAFQARLFETYALKDPAD